MGTYRNPILPGCHPDPSICRVNDTYYLITSTFEYLPGLPIHTSHNLVDWELIGHAIERPEQLDLDGIPSSKGLYAPTIRFHNGKYFVVCTVIDPRKTGQPGAPSQTGHFLVTADDPRGPWSQPLWFDNLDGYDPSLTFDGDRVWLCGTRVADPGKWPGQTDVWLRELDAVSLLPMAHEYLIWQGALDGAGYAEGPHIFSHPDGGWFLVAAEGGTDRDHAVCVAYADEITGPYTGDRGNPRLTHRDLGNRALIANIGHVDLVTDPTGANWAVLLATRTNGNGKNNLLGRQTHLVPVGWEDGRPLFAPGTARVTAEVTHPGISQQGKDSRSFDDHFTSEKLDHGWNGVGRFPATFACPGHKNGLSLEAGSEPWTLGQQSSLLRRLPSNQCHALARLYLPESGVRLGVLLRTSGRALLTAIIDSTGRITVQTIQEGEQATVESTQLNQQETVDIGVRVTGWEASVALDGADLMTTSVDFLCTGKTSMFVGSWVGVCAIGTGQAHVRWFHMDHQENIPRTSNTP